MNDIAWPDRWPYNEQVNLPSSSEEVLPTKAFADVTAAEARAIAECQTVAGLLLAWQQVADALETAGAEAVWTLPEDTVLDLAKQLWPGHPENAASGRPRFLPRT